MPMSFRLSVVMTLLLALTAYNLAHAGDPSIRKPKMAEAVEHLARGNKLYNVRSFEEAALEYKAGALVEPAPIFDYNLGQCYRQLKKYQDAIWHYERFAKASPETPEHVATVQKFITDMKGELSSKAITEPPTEPGPTTTTTPAPLPPPAAALAPSAAAAPLAVTARGESWYADGFGWGLAGVGVASAVVGGALLLNASSINDEANRTASQDTAKALHDKADQRQLLGGVIAVGGGALLVTGLIKLAIHPQDTVVTSVGIGVSARGIAVFGRF